MKFSIHGKGILFSDGLNRQGRYVHGMRGVFMSFLKVQVGTFYDLNKYQQWIVIFVEEISIRVHLIKLKSEI